MNDIILIVMKLSVFLNKPSDKRTLIEQNNDIIDFQFQERQLRLGPCTFSENVGFLSMFPFRVDTEKNSVRLAALVAGTTLQNMFDILMLSKPTIPPMTRQPFSNTYPDFIVTSDDVHHMGMGGFLAAGFWGYDWKFDDRSSYISYCKPPVEIQKEKEVDLKKIEL